MMLNLGRGLSAHNVKFMFSREVTEAKHRQDSFWKLILVVKT